MDKTISQLIKQTFNVLNQKWSIFMCAGALQLVFSLAFVLLLPPFGYVLAWAFFSVTNVNLALHSLKRLEDKKTKLENIFSLKNYFSILTTKVVRLIQVLFWSIFLIVPGILIALDYSMIDFLLAKNTNQDGFETLEQSTELVKNSRAKLFVFWLLYVLLSAIIFLFASSIIIIIKMFTPIPLTLSLSILMIIFGILFLIVVLPFIHVSQALIFESLNQTHQRAQAKQEFVNPKQKKIQTDFSDL